MNTLESIKIGDVDVLVFETPGGLWGLDHAGDLFVTENPQAFYFKVLSEYPVIVYLDEEVPDYNPRGDLHVPCVNTRGKLEQVMLALEKFHAELPIRPGQEIYIGEHKGVIQYRNNLWCIDTSCNKEVFTLGQDPILLLGHTGNENLEFQDPAQLLKLVKYYQQLWLARPRKYVGINSLTCSSFINIRDYVGVVRFDSQRGMWYVLWLSGDDEKAYGENIRDIVGYFPDRFIRWSGGLATGFRALSDLEKVANILNAAPGLFRRLLGYK